MNAPLEKIFVTAADLSLWPKILPHYRWVRYIEQSPDRNVVVMAARRKWLPLHWTSEQEIDAARREVRFHHLKAFTKGMCVVWTFTPRTNGIEVKICHDLESNIPFIGRFIADRIIGGFFVDYIAKQTLTHLKKYVESQ